ncbi:MAG: ketopantoate reductase family protein [Actinomycetota bacterium]
MRIAVVGCGSLGTVVGALLTRGGLDVVMVDAKEEAVAALNRDGARIVGNLEVTQPVKAVAPEGMEGIYDLVVYLAKSTYDEVALPQVLPHLGEESMVLTLQNGVPEERVASFVGRERVLGGAVMWSAEMIAPGVSRMTSDPEQMDYEIGELDGGVTPRLRQVKEVMDHAGKATMMDNLAGVRWTKLLFNVAASGMSTALGAVGSQLMESDKATDAIIYIMLETILTARALGVDMAPMRGVDPGILIDISRQDMDNTRNLLRGLVGDFADAKASMLQDLEKGLRCEVESINGYLSAMAAKAGVAAPVNGQVTRIIRDIQDGRLKLDFSNLDLIELPPLSDYFPEET